jgi:FAD dependent oxidoreductase
MLPRSSKRRFTAATRPSLHRKRGPKPQERAAPASPKAKIVGALSWKRVSVQSERPPKTSARIERKIAVRGVKPTSQSYDIAVVGAGICGLAHALAAARRGKRVVVIDRDAQANGASIRNFGFITVTGQQAGTWWRRAKRSVGVWLEVAEAAKIPIVQRGLLTIARRPEARAVIEAFLQTDMGVECRLVEPRELNDYGSGLRTGEFAGALYSPHEARVESREAIP